jgi:hypothetical protein
VFSSPNFWGIGRWRTRTGHQNHRPSSAAIDGVISNDSGSLSIGGATIAYGAWFYLVAGIAVVSLLVAVGIYFLGNATSARAVRTTQTS